MAVYSSNPDVDPVGACVGTNGMRVNAVVDQLGGEKIDIINWDENPAYFIENALSRSDFTLVAFVGNPYREGEKTADTRFFERLGTEEKESLKAELPELKYEGLGKWDSVSHMDLIADLESAFDIQMDTKDVLDLSNYEKGKEVLGRYGISFEE